MIAEVTLHGTKEGHVYGVLRSSDNKYHIFDNSLRERILGEVIGAYIGSHKISNVICVHKTDVKLDDICQTFR